MQQPSGMSDDLNSAILAVQKASLLIKAKYSGDLIIQEKADASLVTEADIQAEQCIIGHLQNHSSHAIISEESGFLAGKTDSTWIIDPIDGTTNFTRNIPWCAISVALEKEGEMQIGVIQNLMDDTLFFAEKKIGAYMNYQPVQVSNISKPERAIVYIEHGRSSKAKSNTIALEKKLNDKFHLRLMGSTAYEMTLVASGKADAFLCCEDKIWDYAAGLCLIEAAGGVISDWQGHPLKGESDFILASNRSLHPLLVSLIGELQDE